MQYPYNGIILFLSCCLLCYFCYTYFLHMIHTPNTWLLFSLWVQLAFRETNKRENIFSIDDFWYYSFLCLDLSFHQMLFSFSFNVSYSADLLDMNYFSFCLSKELFTSPSLCCTFLLEIKDMLKVYSFISLKFKGGISFCYLLVRISASILYSSICYFSFILW